MDRLAEVMFSIKTYSFSPGRGGVAGNIDSGGEAAWYVWAAIGLFPVAGMPLYIITVPSFSGITVQFGPKTAIVVSRTGVGQYVQTASFDSKDLMGRAYLATSEVHAEGQHTLELAMGKEPNLHWGSKRPP